MSQNKGNWIQQTFGSVEHFVASAALKAVHDAQAVWHFIYKNGGTISKDVQAADNFVVQNLPQLEKMAAQYGADAEKILRISMNWLGRGAVAAADVADVAASKGLNLAADAALLSDLKWVYDKMMGNAPASAPAPAPAATAPTQSSSVK